MTGLMNGVEHAASTEQHVMDSYFLTHGKYAPGPGEKRTPPLHTPKEEWTPLPSQQMLKKPRLSQEIWFPVSNALVVFATPCVTEVP